MMSIELNLFLPRIFFSEKQCSLPWPNKAFERTWGFNKKINIYSGHGNKNPCVGHLLLLQDLQAIDYTHGNEWNARLLCVVNKAVVLHTRPAIFLQRLIFLNLQTYLCLCVVSGHAPSQRALQEWPVRCVRPSVAAAVLHEMFDKRLKFQKNGSQSCWKPGGPSKGRGKPKAEACISSNVKSNAHSCSLSLHHCFFFDWVQCFLTRLLQPRASSAGSNTTCLQTVWVFGFGSDSKR